MLHVRRLLAAAVLATSLAGCPREVQPPPPGEAQLCEEHPDCNDGRTCGLLALCVGGFCEEEGTVAVPCPEDGTPVPMPTVDGSAPE